MSDMIEKIADCLLQNHMELMSEVKYLSDEVSRLLSYKLEDHIDLMNQNKLLRESLKELLDEHHPEEFWTAEHIEFEMEQGNMMAPVVKRAYAALREGDK